MNTPRLRMFAGPNRSGSLKLSLSNLTANENELYSFFYNHSLLEKANLTKDVKKLIFINNAIDFSNVCVNSYYASVCADFIRHELLKLQISFTFETVMSSKDKVEFLKKAQHAGYRTYLYFIATQDPIVNIFRVKNRVKLGGHDVPTDKIVSRYYRSLEFLSEAVKYSNRAYIFDNSSQEKLWIAQIDNGKEFEFKSEIIPEWVDRYLLNAN
jgi:predicted ABC-type ATPase